MTTMMATPPSLVQCTVHMATCHLTCPLFLDAIKKVTLEILKRNAEIHTDVDGEGGHGLIVNFKGMMVGNPYVDPYTNTITQFQTLYNHGVIPKYPSYQPWSDHCSHDRNRPHLTTFLIFRPTDNQDQPIDRNHLSSTNAHSGRL